MNVEKQLNRLGERGNHISNDQATSLFRAVCNLPPDQFPRGAELFDKLKVPDNFPGRIARSLAPPTQWEMLRALSDRPIPNKAQLSDTALKTLESQARLSPAMKLTFYPDVPQIPDQLTSFQTDTPWLDHQLRRMTAQVFPHPLNGFPEIWYEDTRPGWPRKLQARNSYDFEMVRALYYEMVEGTYVLKKGEIWEDLMIEFGKVSELENPPESPEVLDLWKFLGMPDEETFIRETEKILLDRVWEKKGDTDELKKWMDFSKKTDAVRQPTHDNQLPGKRISGESYYCHSLMSAWLLWTMIEDDLHTAQDVREAVEDIEVELGHDFLEDLNSSIDPRTFVLTVSGVTGQLQLTYKQNLIFQAIKKEKYDDGAHWLTKIQNIRDPRNDTPLRNAQLKRRAARCKLADRLSNFFTITSTKEPYYDTLRKLDETYYAFRQLVGLSLFSGLPTFAGLNKLESLYEQEKEGINIWGLLDAVDVERKILIARFGLRFLHHLYTINESLATRIKDVISEKNVPWNQDMAQFPPFWQKRFEQLCACYHLQDADRRKIFSPLDPSQHLGISNLARRLKGSNKQTPWDFQDLLHYFHEAREFNRNYLIARGVLPGGVDDLFVPREVKIPGDIFTPAGKFLQKYL